MPKKVSINLNDESLKFVDEYAKKNGVNRTEAINSLIQRKEMNKMNKRITMNFNEELLNKVEVYAQKNGINRTAAIHFLLNIALKNEEKE